MFLVYTRNMSVPDLNESGRAAQVEPSGLRAWLENAGSVPFVLYAGLAAFCAYFSMYAFRKPFTAATFDDVQGWGFAIDYKTALVIAQVIGYALSKFIGIRIISEMPAGRRGWAIVGLIGTSWLALLAFGMLPARFGVIALFFNGLPLGLIWGLVFAYLEGRRTSEVLGAVLCASFILSTGVAKSVGAWLMIRHGVSEMWMPAMTGAIFMPLLAISVFALSQLPPPGPLDELERTRRAPMNRQQRIDFLRQYAPGLLFLVLAYLLFTAFRDFRDNFSAEIWLALGHSDAALLFTATEIPVAVLALASLGVVMIVRDNQRALLLMHALIAGGAGLIGVSTLAFNAGWLAPLPWMVLSGAGLYLAYAPFNAMLFDRLIAVTRQVGTAGFLIYVADASGYLASVGLLLFRNFAVPDIAWLQFYETCAYLTSIGGIAFVGGSAWYFRHRTWRARRLATYRPVEDSAT
jgi:hypothetical protein